MVDLEDYAVARLNLWNSPFSYPKKRVVREVFDSLSVTDRVVAESFADGFVRSHHGPFIFREKRVWLYKTSFAYSVDLEPIGERVNRFFSKYKMKFSCFTKGKDDYLRGGGSTGTYIFSKMVEKRGIRDKVLVAFDDAANIDGGREVSVCDPSLARIVVNSRSSDKLIVELAKLLFNIDCSCVGGDRFVDFCPPCYSQGYNYLKGVELGSGVEVIAENHELAISNLLKTRR